MQQISIAVGVIGLLAVGWFLVHESSIDYVATVDDELSKLESELAALDGAMIESEAAAAAKDRISTRLSTINQSLAASQNRELSAAQTQMLADGLVRLQEMLEQRQDALTNLDQTSGLATSTESGATIAGLTQTIGAIQAYLAVPDATVPTTTATTTDSTVATTTGTTTPAALALEAKPWTWVQTTYSDGTSLAPNQPEDFVLTFTADNTVSISTDCNSINGGYELDGNQITFGPLTMTKMLCEDSQEQGFVTMLDQVQSFFFTSDGELVFDLRYDSGSAVFR